MQEAFIETSCQTVVFKTPAIYLGLNVLRQTRVTSCMNNTFISDSEHHNLNLTICIFDWVTHSNHPIEMPQTCNRLIISRYFEI